jgi:hypothetical protein
VHLVILFYSGFQRACLVTHTSFHFRNPTQTGDKPSFVFFFFQPLRTVGPVDETHQFGTTAQYHELMMLKVFGVVRAIKTTRSDVLLLLF